MATAFRKQQEWVNRQFGNMTRGKRVSRSKQKNMLRRLWRKAKKMFK